MSEDADIPSWAVRGSKVSYVGAEWTPERIAENCIRDPGGITRYPVHGGEYTIREVRVRFVSEFMEVLVGLLLDEIRNPCADAGGSANGEEMGFWIGGFRPLKRAKAERNMELEVS